MARAALALASMAAIGTARNKDLQVTADAVWTPGTAVVESIRKECAKGGGDCVIAKMGGSASPAAVAFTKSIGGEGWLRDFRKIGRVDIAYVEYPLRAGGGWGWLLANGSPSPVDVDNLQKLPKSEMADNREWAQLIAQHPQAALYPEDRVGSTDPVAIVYADGSEEFVVGYAVRDGCADCPLLGVAFLAFEFNAKGKLGPLEFRGFDADVNAPHPIRLNAGRHFALALRQTQGREWSIAQPPAKWIVREAGQSVQGATLFWTFDVVSNGTTPMTLAEGDQRLDLRIIADPGLGH